MEEDETVGLPNPNPEPDPAPVPGPVKPKSSKVNGWLTRFQEVTAGLFRKFMGAGIVFYSLYSLFGLMNAEKIAKDIRVMIITFIFNLVMVVAGFYYGAAHTKSKLEEKNEAIT